MKMFFRLLGIQLNQRLGLSAFRAGWRDNRKKTVGQALVGFVAVVSIGSLIGMYAWLLTKLMPAFQMLKMESVLLGIVFLSCMVFTLIMGLISLLGVLFFAKDTEFLAALPISSKTVFAAKFGQVLLAETAVGLLFLSPPVIIYGVITHSGVAFWVRAVCAVLFAPCIPLAISALLSLLLMRFNALWRRRDLWTTVGSIALLVAFLLGQFALTSRLPETLSIEVIVALIAGSEGMLQKIAFLFPPSGWVSLGLVQGGGYFALFMIVSLLALLIVIWIAGWLYYRGAQAQLETATNTRIASLSGRYAKQRSTLFSLFLREWRTVLRSPTYAMNGLITIVIGPILLLIPKFMEGSVQGDELSVLFSLLGSAHDPQFFVLLMSAIFLAICLLNPAISTSLSREGQQFYLLRMIPVKPGSQIMAKYLFGFSVSLLSTLLMSISAAVAFGFSLSLIIPSIALATLASVAPLAFSFLPDVLKPKLFWNNETEAIKQNMNAMLGMLIGWAYVAMLIVLAIFGIKKGITSTQLVYFATVCSVLLGAAGIWALHVADRHTWKRVEG